MAKKSKKQQNAEFLEKIKTITVGTGAKPSDNCPKCGEPFTQHIPVLAIPIPIPVPEPKTKPKTESTDEVAFSA